MLHLGIIIILLIAILWTIIPPRANIPSHLLGHPIMKVKDMVPKEIGVKLNDILREMREFPTNINADLKTGYSGCNEDIGEYAAILPNGQCDSPYTVPNINRTHCIYPQRIDVGKHFLSTGGPDAIRENIKDMTSRVQSFARYLTGASLEKYSIIKKLFYSDEFTNAAKAICPADEQVLDPFQFTVLIQIPGQTVATHLDAPYFWGAGRCNIPQWLLASMKFSGLFEDIFINQVQVVSYLHDWKPAEKPGVGSDFIYYLTKDGVLGSLAPEPLAGNLVDGSKVVHAATIYYPDRQAPLLDKDQFIQLEYVGDEKWYVVNKETGEELGTYDSDELRISLVYRAKCFKSKEDVEKYRTYPLLTADSILEVFARDLVEKGIYSNIEELLTMSKLDFGMVIMEYYVKYPLPSLKEALIPFNYCALTKHMPWTNSFLKYVCA